MSIIGKDGIEAGLSNQHVYKHVVQNPHSRLIHACYTATFAELILIAPVIVW
jgi:hypothetical protein